QNDHLTHDAATPAIFQPAPPFTYSRMPVPTPWRLRFIRSCHVGHGWHGTRISIIRQIDYRSSKIDHRGSTVEFRSSKTRPFEPSHYGALHSRRSVARSAN